MIELSGDEIALLKPVVQYISLVQYILDQRISIAFGICSCPFSPIYGGRATSPLIQKKKDFFFFLFHLYSATPPIADLTLRSRVGFYHLAADLICATALLKKA